jgi:hypothetical protein
VEEGRLVGAWVERDAVKLGDADQITVEKFMFSLGVYSRIFIGDNNPISGINGSESPCSSNIWLIEHGHHKVTVVYLKLRIQVLLLISLINKAVKSLTVGSILVQNIHGYDILSSFQVFGLKEDSVSIINLVYFLTIYV